MSRLPLPSRHRIAIPVCLFVGLICLSSSSSAQLQEMTTEAWIEAIDDAFDAPEKELLPSAAVFPMVDETGKICENGLGVSSHANYLYEFCPHRMSHTSALWYHVVFRGGGEHLAGFEIDEAEIELYAASLDADYYYFPMLTEVAGGYELVIQRAFAGELEQEEIYRGTLTEAEYPSLANRIAAEMFKDRGAKLTPEEQAYLDRPQLKDREAADQFGKLSDGSLKEDEMLDLLRENPTCFAAWMTTISSEIKKDSCLEELVKHKDEVDIDLIIYFNSFAFEAIETDQLLLMLNRAPELKSNVDYSRSLSQYLFMECESEVDDHFISVWAGMADSYSELHVLSRAVRRLGWNVRGGGSVAQTPPEAMLVFGERSKEAYGYAQEALQINPEGWQTHLMGIEYGTEAGGQEIARQHFNSLIELRPRCRKAWKAYFRAMQPRWGGELKNSLEFAMRCAESDDWDLGIPQLSIAMLQDLADPAYIRGFSHETFANELVWAVARTYYERALASDKMSDKSKEFIRNRHALFGAYGGHYEEVAPILVDLREKGYNYEAWPSSCTRLYYHDLTMSRTADGETQLWSELQTSMAHGDLDRAQEITDNWDKSDPEVMEDYLRTQAGIDLGRRLVKEKDITISPQEFKNAFLRMSDMVSVKNKDTVLIKVPKGENPVLIFPYGFQNAVISGTLKFKGNGVFELVANARAAQDQVSLHYRTDKDLVYLKRDKNFLAEASIDSSRPMRFQILKLEGGFLMVIESGEQWTARAYKSVPSGFAFVVHSKEGVFEAEISDLKVKLVDPPKAADR